MYTYSWYQWIILFFIYCFIGWCFESTYVSLAQRKLTNRGFLRGPLLPIYGSGAIIILFATIPVKDNYLAVFIFGMLAATLLELVTGYVMEQLFKVRYWDYSKKWLNFKGYICLSSSIAWGVMSILLLEFIHPPIEKFALSINSTLAIILSLALLAYFFYDFIVSAKTALDLSKVIGQLNEIRAQLNTIEETVHEFTESIIDEVTESRKALHQQLEDRRERLRKEYDNIVEHLNKVKQALLTRNPSSTSYHYPEALQDLKEYLKKIDRRKK